MSNRSNDWIPNIVVGKDYDERYEDAAIHYELLENFAQFYSYDMPVHRHVQFSQIHFINQGTVNFHIDDRIYQSRGPVCFFTPASVPHSFLFQAGATGHVLTLHQSLIWRLMKEGLAQSVTASLNEGVCLDPSEFVESQKSQWAVLEQIFNNIQLEWAAEQPAKSLILEHHSRLLIILIARLSTNPAKSTKSGGASLRVFRNFSDLIEENYKEHWPVRVYTDKLAISEGRLNQICRNISNNSPKKLINDRLLQEAKRLIMFTNLYGNEICYKLGFTDPAYFSRFFKRHTNMTILEFKQTHVSPGHQGILDEQVLSNTNQNRNID